MIALQTQCGYDEHGKHRPLMQTLTNGVAKCDGCGSAIAYDEDEDVWALATTPQRGEKDVVYSRDGQSCRCVHCAQPAIVFNGVAECINGEDCVREYGVRV